MSGNTLWPVRKVNGRCELVCFNLIRGGVPADLPVSGLRAGVETWAFRNAEILTIDGIEQIFPF